jgi:hypothetical protein
MSQLKVRMKGKEWDSGVGRDGTYGKCGRKKGKLRERNQQQQERLLGRLGGGKPLQFMIRSNCLTMVLHRLGCAT